MAPDGAKMVQDEAKTEPRWGPDESRRKKTAEQKEVYTLYLPIIQLCWLHITYDVVYVIYYVLY